MTWDYDGRERPTFADTPNPGQESVWDYPRPPAIQPDERRITVRSYELLIAESSRALRVLETASAPGFYLPGGSSCEWKGSAVYFDLNAPWGEVRRVGWTYPEPHPEFAAITGYIAFYPARLECYVDGERVRSQPGGFYGGWVTSDLAGPVKGAPGTEGW